MQKHIYLIGFMGTGKSTISRRLRKLLQVQEVDMDAMIVDENKMTINDMFATYGEAYFRQKETETLERLAKEAPMIISCGGGTVMRPENVQIMKRSGCTVLLQATPETVYHRVKNGKARPLLQGNMNIPYIKALMDQRRPAYEAAADLRVDTDFKGPETIAKEIIKLLNKQGLA